MRTALASGNSTSRQGRQTRSSSTSRQMRSRTRSSSKRSRTRSTASTCRHRAGGRSFPRAGRSLRLRPSAAISRALRRTGWRHETRPRSGPTMESCWHSSATVRDGMRSGSAILKARPRRRSPISTTRKARSSGHRTRRPSSTRPPTGSSIATPSPMARRPSSPRATSAASDRWRSLPTASGSRSRSRIALSARTSTSSRSPAARSATSPTTGCSTRRATPSGRPTADISSLRPRKAPAAASRRRAA